MVPTYDIFRIDHEREPLWIEAASSIDEAKTRVQQLAASSQGEYFIFNHATGTRISIAQPDTEN